MGVKDSFTQFVRLGLVILALGMVLYWVEVTWFAEARIVCDQEALDREAKRHMCWQTLMQQYGKDRILWLDARPLADYEVNHLAGTNTYPFRPDNKQEQFDFLANKFDSFPQDRCIVVFCTGACTASEDMVAFLRSEECDLDENLRERIFVLDGGWDVIRQKAPEMLLVR